MLIGPSVADPIRQIFMIGLIWRLANDSPRRRLEILEIGSWIGASARTWGEGLDLYCGAGGRVTCIDAWEPYFDLVANPALGYRRMNGFLESDIIYANFRTNMESMPDRIDVDVLRGYSQDILPTLASGCYDLVYIDGDHGYDAVRSDIANAMRLVADGGILCGDDLEIQKHEIGDETDLRSFTTEFARLPDLGKEFHPGVTAAVAEAFGPVSSWHGLWGMRRCGNRWEPVELTGMPPTIPSFLSPKDLLTVRMYFLRNNLF